MILSELYQEEPTGTFTHDGAEYNLNKLFKLVDADPIAYFKVADLAWILKEDKRTDDADLKTPILVTVWKHKWVVLDGAHRLQKALDQKVEQLPGKIVSHDMLKQTLKRK